ncbi:hypothetical protein REO35_04270 [Clostridium perfringens]|uniref:hypothetical protein n=1 Tax=Clostridium perfringens TaxID=1502 RepID=UPI00244AEDD1|nr:hypothetical protein [Clostridium perfringens]MDH2474247.1 hypothetical protein [Clostridium perfringens]MDT7986922.1 hypothetical protein [Clostridium perfringens]
MKKAIYNVFNGESYEEIAFKTLAAQVLLSNNQYLQDVLDNTPLINVGRDILRVGINNFLYTNVLVTEGDLWTQKYLRIKDWYGGSEDGRLWYKQENHGLYTENVEDFYVQGSAVAKGKNETIGNATIYHIGGGLRLVRQVIKTSAANSGGGVSYTIHFPKAWNWVQPISLVSHNENNTAYNTSGYCTIDTWSTTYLNGGCYQMVAGKPTQIILTYLAG